MYSSNRVAEVVVVNLIPDEQLVVGGMLNEVPKVVVQTGAIPA